MQGIDDNIQFTRSQTQWMDHSLVSRAEWPAKRNDYPLKYTAFAVLEICVNYPNPR